MNVLLRFLDLHLPILYRLAVYIVLYPLNSILLLLSQVEITHMLQCWLCAKPELREVMNQYSPDAFVCLTSRDHPLFLIFLTSFVWINSDSNLLEETQEIISIGTLATSVFIGKVPS